MDNPHILGKLRAPIWLAVGAIVGFMSWQSSDNAVRGLIMAAVGAAAGWLATTEIFIKAALSGVVAVISAFLSYKAMRMAFPNDTTTAFPYIVPGVVGIGLWGLGYLKLDKSSWIGTPCPQCRTRGTVDSEQVGKDFLGTTSETSNLYGDNRTVFYNKYLVTYLNSCSACGEQWQSTSETKERA